MSQGFQWRWGNCSKLFGPKKTINKKKTIQFNKKSITWSFLLHSFLLLICIIYMNYYLYVRCKKQLFQFVIVIVIVMVTVNFDLRLFVPCLKSCCLLTGALFSIWEDRSCFSVSVQFTGLKLKTYLHKKHSV